MSLKLCQVSSCTNKFFFTVRWNNIDLFKLKFERVDFEELSIALKILFCKTDLCTYYKDNIPKSEMIGVEDIGPWWWFENYINLLTFNNLRKLSKYSINTRLSIKYFLFSIIYKTIIIAIVHTI